jgi:cysteinyl-tRNA synthetase
VMANVWMHNGFLQVEGEKMSKSLGNFVTIREALREWPGEVLRFNMLRTHYRQPINWTAAQLRESETELWTWVVRISSRNGHHKAYARAIDKRAPQPSAAVLAALSDDLNTHAAITELRALYKQAEQDDEAAAELMENCEFLGLLRHNKLGVHARTGSYSAPVDTGVGPYWKHHDTVQRIRVAIANGLDREKEQLVRQIEGEGLIVEIDAESHVSLRMPPVQEYELRLKVENLIADRSAARKAKNFKEADRIRDELSAMGIQLKDSKDPKTGEIVTTWEVKR